MNLNKVDLNLFIVFDAIYTEANLTRAGQIVGITQPAVSNALSRLRETFNDPLFVRTAQGMVPTPMAQNIIGPVRNALQLLRVSVQESRSFDPQQANKTYRISMTDLTEAV
ncbi:LysR family transcriptional regulator, partial [Escherichia coli]